MTLGQLDVLLRAQRRAERRGAQPNSGRQQGSLAELASLTRRANARGAR